MGIKLGEKKPVLWTNPEERPMNHLAPTKASPYHELTVCPEPTPTNVPSRPNRRHEAMAESLMDLLWVTMGIVLGLCALTTQERYEEYRRRMPRLQALRQALKDDLVPALGSLALFAGLLMAASATLQPS